MSTLENAGEFSPTASVQVATGATSRALHLPRFGRTFFNPIVDVLLVCGGLSIPFLLFEWQDRSSVSVQGHTKIAIFVLFNFAHFASSTVRLYTKPGASAKHRFLAYGFPVVALVVTLFAIAFPEAIGRQLIALMLTWSPYHYAAQAYGLALMYGYQHTKIAIFVLFNFAHFASSTVRLYTKPGASAKHRFLAYGFPVVALVVTLFAIAFPEAIGRQLIALMLTWSPYHYAAQAYGLVGYEILRVGEAMVVLDLSSAVHSLVPQCGRHIGVGDHGCQRRLLVGARCGGRSGDSPWRWAPVAGDRAYATRLRHADCVCLLRPRALAAGGARARVDERALADRVHAVRRDRVGVCGAFGSIPARRNPGARKRQSPIGGRHRSRRRPNGVFLRSLSSLVSSCSWASLP